MPLSLERLDVYTSIYPIPPSDEKDELLAMAAAERPDVAVCVL